MTLNQDCYKNCKIETDKRISDRSSNGTFE